MSDELTKVLARFEPFTGSEEAANMLARWTKYERLEGTFPVNLGDDLSVVAVQSPATSGIALVLRSLEEQVPLEGGKTFNVYAIDGLCKATDAAEAEAMLADIRRAHDARIEREVGGFGPPAERPARPGEEDLGF